MVLSNSSWEISESRSLYVWRECKEFQLERFRNNIWKLCWDAKRTVSNVNKYIEGVGQFSQALIFSTDDEISFFVESMITVLNSSLLLGKYAASHVWSSINSSKQTHNCSFLQYFKCNEVYYVFFTLSVYTFDLWKGFFGFERFD